MEVLVVCIFLLLSGSSANELDSQNTGHNTYFEKINFNHATKVMKISNSNGEEIINARLGTSFNITESHPCASENQIPGHVCLECEQKARLYIHAYDLDSTVKCYNLKWHALSNTDELTDCFEFSDKEHWFGGGQNAQWSLELDKGTHKTSPFITGRIGEHQWGNVLRRYFISSRGAALLIDNLTPLFTSLSRNNNKQFCLTAQYDEFAFVKPKTENVQLNYSICTSSNSNSLQSKLIGNTLWDGLKKKDFDTIDSLITEPIWTIDGTSAEVTEEKITNFIQDIIQQGFLKQGHILVNEFWQKHIGDFTVDVLRFPNLRTTIDVLHRRGFRIVLTLQPLISNGSLNFAEAANKGLFIEETCDSKKTALTSYKSVQSAGVLDSSKNETNAWLSRKVKDLSEEYQIDSLYLDTGVAFDIPHHSQCSGNIVNPDNYKNLLVKSLNSINLFGVSSAIERPKPPTFITLPQVESSWIGLRRVIPTILSYGIIGYPFVMPGAVGGDFKIQKDSHQNLSKDPLPEKELYIRWLQIASFLPVIKFSYLPSGYGDNTVLEIARNFTELRQRKVAPLLKKYARISLDTALPIIRPLWMLDATNPVSYTVEDEFAIGDDLIVAPILYSGAEQRDIYLPTGIWKDGIDGTLRKGGRWIKNYKSKLNEVAFFDKIPSIMNI